MKVCLPDEIPHDDMRLHCRQSRLMGAVGILGVAVVLAGAPFLWHYLGAPWLVWGGCALVAVFVVPFLIGDLRARLRPTAWVLLAGSDGIWINLRSYANWRLEAAATAVYLEYGDIESARRHVESYSTPTASRGRSSIRWKDEHLELRLKSSDTQELQAALSAERHRKAPERVYFGIVHVRGKSRHFPVTMPSGDVVRVAWRGGRGNSVVPSLDRVLDEFSQPIRLAEATRQERADWDELSDAELNEQILELARAGARIEAIRLLKRTRGYTATQAHRFVEEVSRRIEL